MVNTVVQYALHMFSTQDESRLEDILRLEDAVDRKERELHPGDVVNIPANVKHWHGAASDSWFSHLAIEIEGTEGKTEWCEAVSDDDYNKLK